MAPLRFLVIPLLNCIGTYFGSFNSDVKNGVPVTRYNTMTPCSGNTTIEVTNLDADSKYWVIVADVDCLSYFGA